MTLELYLLDVPRQRAVIALARRGADTAIERIPIDRKLRDLASFANVIAEAISGDSTRPSALELNRFGESLFDFLFRGTIRDLYNLLPTDATTLQILSNKSEIRAVPWEYFVAPHHRPSPHRDRSIVRVHPTCGLSAPVWRSEKRRIRVLLVSADPIEQQAIGWADFEKYLSRVLASYLPADIELKIVEGTDRLRLSQAVAAEQFDVFHFYGHGDVDPSTKSGRLLLQNSETGVGDYLSVTDLAVALAGTGVRLAILSACSSAAGSHGEDFGTVATGLISAGVPAVIANQYPVPIKSIAPFVGAVYQTLATSGNIDKAVSEGRAGLKVGLGATTGEEAVLEWGIPVLYRLSNCAQIFAP